MAVELSKSAVEPDPYAEELLPAALELRPYADDSTPAALELTQDPRAMASGTHIQLSPTLISSLGISIQIR